MRDSDTYMAILEEGHKEGHKKGRIEELNRMILRLGQKSFGPADETVKTFLAGIEDLDRFGISSGTNFGRQELAGTLGDTINAGSVSASRSTSDHVRG